MSGLDRLTTSTRFCFRRVPHQDFRINDWQAFCSVACFAIFAQIGGRLLPGKPKSRARIMLSTWFQVILTVLSAVTARKRSCAILS